MQIHTWDPTVAIESIKKQQFFFSTDNSAHVYRLACVSNLDIFRQRQNKVCSIHTHMSHKHVSLQPTFSQVPFCEKLFLRVICVLRDDFQKLSTSESSDANYHYSLIPSSFSTYFYSCHKNCSCSLIIKFWTTMTPMGVFQTISIYSAEVDNFVCTSNCKPIFPRYAIRVWMNDRRICFALKLSKSP